MPTHRVEFGLKGTSHYIDNRFHDATGFPLWQNELPRGLHLKKRVGRPSNKDRKFVRTPGVGRTVEWTSNEDARGPQRNPPRAGPPPGQQRGPPRNPPRAGPPPGQQRGPRPGPQRGERRERQGQDAGLFGEQPGQEARQRQRRDPGLFNVSPGDSEDEDEDHDDAPHEQAPAMRANDGIVNYWYHGGHLQGHSRPDNFMRESASGWRHRERGRAYDQCADGYDDDEDLSACSMAHSRRDVSGIAYHQHHDVNPRGYDGPDPAMRRMGNGFCSRR